MAPPIMGGYETRHNQKSKSANGFVTFWRKVYHPLGFRHGYNFPLFVILVGALMGFVLARLQYLSIDGIFLKSTIPGEAYWYQTNFRRIGITLHLAAILPAGFLVCFQFVPVIRHKFLIFHRINGYVIILLFFVSTAGVLMIVRHAVGGSPNTQASMGMLVILTTFSIIMSYYNIKRLQIDQHRAWMIRAWVLAGSIITLRIIMAIANSILWKTTDYYTTMPCAEIYFDYKSVGVPDAHNPTSLLYHQCTDPNSSAIALVRVGATGPETVAAAFHLTFGMSAWLAMALHIFGAELYLRLTPAEGERLRVVSYERQLEAGFKDPGRAGLVNDKFADIPKWTPPKPQSEMTDTS